jgi:hypothetical protein
MSGHPVPTRERYLAAVLAALTRPAGDDADAALHAFLTLNAGYFLGEWLQPEAHAELVHRLAAALDRAGGLTVPDDTVHALQLAQHVRELATEFGPLPGLAPLIEQTTTLLPDHPEDWDAALRTASLRTPDAAGVHDLLAVHARRRLWELEHPPAATNGPALAPEYLLSVAGEAARGTAHTIQAAEAALAELTAHPTETAAVRAALLSVALTADRRAATAARAASSQPRRAT